MQITEPLMRIESDEKVASSGGNFEDKFNKMTSEVGNIEGRKAYLAQRNTTDLDNSGLSSPQSELQPATKKF